MAGLFQECHTVGRNEERILSFCHAVMLSAEGELVQHLIQITGSS